MNIKDKAIMRLAKSRRASAIMMAVTKKNVKIAPYKPDIYLALGVASAGVAVGVLVRAILSHDDVVGETRATLDEANSVKDSVVDGAYFTDTDKEIVASIPKLQGHYVRQVVLHYAPSALLGATSLYLIMASHGLLRNQNKSLLATAVLLDRGFSEYRRRVIEDQDEDADRRYMFGGTKEPVTKQVMGKGGKKRNVKSEETKFDPNASPLLYSRVLDETSREYNSNREVNMFMLATTQENANRILRIKGIVFLNEVYTMLGFEKSHAGQIVGWSLDGTGDNFIDFGLDSDMNTQRGDASVVLDFNVNGVVLEYLPG